MAASLKNVSEPSQHDKPCAEGNDNRYSDLCAQWKAADAAKSASNAAWWIGAIGSLIGALTLGAAWRAATWAKEAAKHTDRGAVEAARAAKAAEDALEHSRNTSHSDLRAWVSIDIELLKAGREPAAAVIDARINLKNIGKTPALRVGVSLCVQIVPSIRSGQGIPPDTERRKTHMPSLMPGGETEQGFGQRLTNDEVTAGMELAKRHGCDPVIYLDAVVSYSTVFDAVDDEPRFTSIRYIMVPTISDPSAREARFRWLVNGPWGVDSVIFRQDKGAPIHMT